MVRMLSFQTHLWGLIRVVLWEFHCQLIQKIFVHLHGHRSVQINDAVLTAKELLKSGYHAQAQWVRGLRCPCYPRWLQPTRRCCAQLGKPKHHNGTACICARYANISALNAPWICLWIGHGYGMDVPFDVPYNVPLDKPLDVPLVVIWTSV